MIRMRPGLPTWHAITDGHWRATINADTGEAVELFDLDSDHDENNQSRRRSGFERTRSLS